VEQNTLILFNSNVRIAAVNRDPHLWSGRKLLPMSKFTHYVPGLAALCGFLCVAILLSVPRLLTDSPVVQRNQIVGQVVGAAPSPINPKGIISTGLQIVYDVALSDGRRIQLVDSRTYRVGTQVSVERATRRNGSQFYAFSRTDHP